MVVCRRISAVTLSRMGTSKGWPVITPDRGSRYLQLYQTQNTLTISTVLWVFGQGRGDSWSEDSHRANQVGWGFEPTACGALSLWGRELAFRNCGRGYGKTRDGEEAKVLPSWTETQRRKRHRLPAALETCYTHVRRRHGKVLGPCCPGAAH